MIVNLKAFALGIFTVAIIAVLGFNLCVTVADWAGSSIDASDIHPFVYPAIIHEAADGKYHPVTDPAFLIGTLFSWFIPFFAGCFVARWKSRQGVALSVLGISLMCLAFMHRAGPIWRIAPLRSGALLILIGAALSGMAGLLLANHMRRGDKCPV